MFKKQLLPLSPKYPTIGVVKYSFALNSAVVGILGNSAGKKLYNVQRESSMTNHTRALLSARRIWRRSGYWFTPGILYRKVIV